MQRARRACAQTGREQLGRSRSAGGLGKLGGAAEPARPACHCCRLGTCSCGSAHLLPRVLQELGAVEAVCSQDGTLDHAGLRSERRVAAL